MKKTDKNKVKEFIRVDHAGERGAIKIYEGQLLALKTFKQNEYLKKTIEKPEPNFGVFLSQGPSRPGAATRAKFWGVFEPGLANMFRNRNSQRACQN